MKAKKCPNCKGTGKYTLLGLYLSNPKGDNTITCPVCQGKGKRG